MREVAHRQQTKLWRDEDDAILRKGLAVIIRKRRALRVAVQKHHHRCSRSLCRGPDIEVEAIFARIYGGWNILKYCPAFAGVCVSLGAASVVVLRTPGTELCCLPNTFPSSDRSR